MQAVEDTTYNGWKNYPTWCVNLWLSNDESLCNQTYELVRGQLSFQHLEMNGLERLRVGDYLKVWVTDELTPDLGASFPSDLLGYALDQVDWYEIADAWIETVTED